MANHTPGPWQAFCDDQGYDIIAGDGTHVASVEPVNAVFPEREQDANGHLLAAAPELLAALYRLAKAAGMVGMRRHAGNPITPDMWSDMYHAINYALGVIHKAEIPWWNDKAVVE